MNKTFKWALSSVLFLTAMVGVMAQAQKCFSDSDCVDGACMFPIGSCGEDGQAGRCYWIDDSLLCPDVYKPVCGCDGVTYGNSCHAIIAGASIRYEGVCEESAEEESEPL